MSPYRLGMKVYDNDWYLKHGLDYDAAAALLADWGVGFVITQSRLLAMPDSAVKSEIEPHLAARYAAYDDRKFRDALGKRGIQYIASCLMFFDPAALAADPSLAAIGNDGLAMPKIDWYVGIPPTRQRHVARKLAAIEAAVRAYEPDGIHLGFTRWPGFWELWMPHHKRADFPEYSYDGESLDRFVAETGVALPTREPKAAATWIDANARDAWTRWKCRVVVDVIRRSGHGTPHRPRHRDTTQHAAVRRGDFDDAADRDSASGSNGPRRGRRHVRGHGVSSDPDAPGLMDSDDRRGGEVSHRSDDGVHVAGGAALP